MFVGKPYMPGRDKGKTIYLTYYDYEDIKDKVKKLLDNKDLWEDLDELSTKLERIEIVITHDRAIQRFLKE